MHSSPPVKAIKFGRVEIMSSVSMDELSKASSKTSKHTQSSLHQHWPIAAGSFSKKWAYSAREITEVAEGQAVVKWSHYPKRIHKGVIKHGAIMMSIDVDAEIMYATVETKNLEILNKYVEMIYDHVYNDDYWNLMFRSHEEMAKLEEAEELLHTVAWYCDKQNVLPPPGFFTIGDGGPLSREISPAEGTIKFLSTNDERECPAELTMSQFDFKLVGAFGFFDCYSRRYSNLLCFPRCSRRSQKGASRLLWGIAPSALSRSWSVWTLSWRKPRNQNSSTCGMEASLST